MTAAVIVQARMGSHRLPGKVMADLAGKPVLWHVLTRAMRIKGADMVLLAVPDESASDQLEALARSLEIATFRGSEHDVLGRYYGAARSVNADHIVRITADCPLFDPHVASVVLEAIMPTPKRTIDYASNVLPRTFEKGLDCEAFTRWALELTNKVAHTAHEREHVTPWMQKAEILNRINIESGEPARAFENWAIDYPEDLERVRLIYEERGLLCG